MATSGSWDYSRSATNIIQSAWEDLGIIIAGGTVPSADSTMALVRLNMLVKQWQGDSDRTPGLKIHSRQRITLFLAKGQQSYLIGPAATDARATTQYGRTTIRAAEASGQTTLDVTARTDTTTYPGTTVTMTNSDFIAVEQDDGTLHWSTISSSSGTGPTVTLGDATTATAAAGNYVYWFTSRAQRFPLIESAVLRNESYNDTPLTIYEDEKQYSLGVSDKYADGDPTAILVEPLRITTRVTLNSQPTDVTKQLLLTALYPAEDYDAGSDDIAFPQEAFLALHWSLAKLCAPAKRVPWTALMEDNYKTAMAGYRNLNPENSVLYYKCGGV